MSTIILQTEIEKRKGIRYQFDSFDEPIGEGGMGKVYKGICINEYTGATRPVAIKFMFDDLPESAYERARREAEIQLRNDNLVEMLGFIVTYEQLPGGAVRKHYHVVSELLTGVPLSDIFEGKTKDRNGEDVAFAVKLLQDYRNDPEHFAKTIIINVLSGLMALHDAGYIHRDIDPTNIMITADGHIKLIDFGIAKQMNTLTTGDKSLTVAGKFMGKPEYAAPELVLGDIAHQNQTTDIYAMGILFYECIVGHTPFEGARHEILDKQLKEKIPLGKIKDKALRRVIATACEKKQELRYQTSAQMRVALENEEGSKREISPAKKYAIIAGAVCIVALLLVVTLVVKHKHDAANHEAEQARIEQQQAEISASINAKIAEGDRLTSYGLSKEDEDKYEQYIMKACVAYSKAIQLAEDNASTDIDMEDLRNKQKTAIKALDLAIEELTQQAEQLSEIGENEIADLYTERVEAIESFKDTLK